MPERTWSEMMERLQAPTPVSARKTRNQSGTNLTYVTARFCQERLDSSVGPDNWQTALQLVGPIWLPEKKTRTGKVMQHEGNNMYPICGVGIRNPETGEWVWKWDVGDYSDIASVKGGISDSFKRACVMWGIARDLYGEDYSEESSALEAQPVLPGPLTLDSDEVAIGLDLDLSALPSTTYEQQGQDMGLNLRPSYNPATDPVAMESDSWKCPVHGVGRLIPAGVSDAGNRYPAFYACTVADCNESQRGGRAKFSG